MSVFPPIDQPRALATVSNKNGAAIATCITNIISPTKTSVIVPLWYYTNPKTEGTKRTAPALIDIPKLKKIAARRGLLMESSHMQITQ